MSKGRSLGFGFKPDESQHHFLAIRQGKTSEQFGKVTIYERFVWNSESVQQKIDVFGDVQAKVEITESRWEIITPAVEVEFNRRLRLKKQAQGKFLKKQTVLGELMGKELLVLAWAIEECELSAVKLAVQNWLGLEPEERWWLYTMTNAATGGIDDHRGWRTALRYALCDNPVGKKQLSLFGVHGNERG